MKTHKMVKFLLTSLICLGWFAPWHAVGAEPVPARNVQASLVSEGPIYTAATLIPCKAQVSSTGQIYSILQEAIQAARDGDTVKVAGYCSDLFPVAHQAFINGVNAPWVAYVDKSLELIGGYEPTFMAPPDPRQYPTTLDARQQGGGILIKGASTVATISGFSIINGLYSGIEVVETTTTIRHNWILGNATGITFTGDSPSSAISIEANYILYNTSAHSAGISVWITQPHLAITNNVICENDYDIPDGEYSGGWGGSGISGSTWSGDIRHNTVCNNRINSQHGAGVQIFGTATLHNNIVWGNTGGEAQISTEGVLTVTHSDVQGGFNGTGNLDCDPQFRNPLGDDFHLLPGSCAIDTGAALNIDQDIDDDPRPPSGPDMGADEINPAHPLNGAIFGQAAHNDHGVGAITALLYAKSTPDVWFVMDTTQTDPLGQYSFSGLADGDYRVGFSDPSGQFEPVFSGQQSSLDTAHNVSIVNPAYAIVNVALGNSGTITGQVTLAGGGDPRPVIITLYERSRPMKSTSPDINGEYAFTGLFTSSHYQIYFAHPPVPNTPEFIPEYYNNATTLAVSQAISVTEGSVTSGIDAQLNPAAPPLAVITGNGTQYLDPFTGQITLGVVNGNASDVLISTQVVCAQGSPSDVTLWVGPNPYPMTETPPPGSGIYQVNLPAEAVVNGQLVVRWRCGEETFEKVIGKFIRYDPSGFVRDAHTGKPIANAIVTLYRVPNGLPDVTLPDKTVERRTCRTTQTRAGGPNGNWKAEPPAQPGMGVFVNPQILNDAGQSDIEPAINAQKTDANGHYGWDVVEGCWYVTVQAKGYRTVYSPVVGVPPAVMDLDLDLDPYPTIFLPVVFRNQ